MRLLDEYCTGVDGRGEHAYLCLFDKSRAVAREDIRVSLASIASCAACLRSSLAMAWEDAVVCWA